MRSIFVTMTYYPKICSSIKAFKIKGKIIEPWNVMLTFLYGQRSYTKHDMHPSNCHYISKFTGPWNIGHWPSVTLRSHHTRFIILTCDSHPSNYLQDIKQNHWTVKYRTRWPTFIIRSTVGSHWLIIPKYDAHLSNSLENLRQNHITLKTVLCDWEFKGCAKLKLFKVLNSSIKYSSRRKTILLAHTDLGLLWGQRLGPPDSLSQSMTFIHQMSQVLRKPVHVICEQQRCR